MWATCNVGADKPEESGLLFHFGLVDGYKHVVKNHKFRTNEQNLEDGSSSQYIPITTSDKVYKCNNVLDLEEELYNNTTHNVETVNGIKGMMFTSKINSQSLFIPFAGYWYTGSFYALGSSANVWSSQVHPSDVNYSYRLNCYSSGNAYINYNNRYCAFSVRGVFNPNEVSNNINLDIFI